MRSLWILWDSSEIQFGFQQRFEDCKGGGSVTWVFVPFDGVEGIALGVVAALERHLVAVDGQRRYFDGGQSQALPTADHQHQPWIQFNLIQLKWIEIIIFTRIKETKNLKKSSENPVILKSPKESQRILKYLENFFQIE